MKEVSWHRVLEVFCFSFWTQVKKWLSYLTKRNTILPIAQEQRQQLAEGTHMGTDGSDQRDTSRADGHRPFLDQHFISVTHAEIRNTQLSKASRAVTRDVWERQQWTPNRAILLPRMHIVLISHEALQREDTTHTWRCSQLFLSKMNEKKVLVTSQCLNNPLQLTGSASFLGFETTNIITLKLSKGQLCTLKRDHVRP